MATDETASRGAEQITIREKLARLGVGDANISYPVSLYQQFLHPTHHDPVIGGDFTPSALLTATERGEQMGVVDYATRLAGDREYITAAKQTNLVITDMDAGLGTSLVRDTYVASIPHLNGRGLGSKGTDTHFHAVALARPVSVMEAKAHHYHHDASSFESTTIEPLLNGESESAYRQFLSIEVPTLRRAKTPLTYRDFLIDPSHHISLTEPLMQPNLPTIDKATDELTNDRTAPGGHGYLATLLLERLADQPPQAGVRQVRVITNGDGINNTASAEMVGFTTREKAGIVMVTTTRTTADVKGGILGLRKNPDGTQYADIMELAQAGDAQQKDLFQAVGLTTTPEVVDLGREHHLNQQYFNTNMALLNEGLLGQFLSQLRASIGQEEFARITTPDLIQNSKKQNGREYIQMEGAMGSVLLKLNQYVTTNPAARKLWADISDNAPFLRIINLDPEARGDYFSPVKNAWDAWLQTASDRFSLDTTTWRLHNNRPGQSIAVNGELLSSPYYKQLHNMRTAFEGTRVLDLDELAITGNPVLLPGAILRGRVAIHNLYDNKGEALDLQNYLPQTNNEQLVLDNVEVTITETGEIQLKQL